MLVYHFLPANHALDDLSYRRLKVATVDDLNDPFELLVFSHPHPQARRELRQARKTMGRKFGMLCFCRNWHNTLLWSHYADKHRGLALGFEVPDMLIRPVQYVRKRPVIQNIDEDTARILLFTKFIDWQYEAEVRIYTNLDKPHPVNGLHFAPFSRQLQLRKIIAGPLCSLKKKAIEETLSASDKSVEVRKARLAFKTFRVVTQMRGFAATG